MLSQSGQKRCFRNTHILFRVSFLPSTQRSPISWAPFPPPFCTHGGRSGGAAGYVFPSSVCLWHPTRCASAMTVHHLKAKLVNTQDVHLPIRSHSPSCTEPFCNSGSDHSLHRTRNCMHLQEPPQQPILVRWLSKSPFRVFCCISFLIRGLVFFFFFGHPRAPVDCVTDPVSSNTPDDEGRKGEREEGGVCGKITFSHSDQREWYLSTSAS